MPDQRIRLSWTNGVVPFVLEEAAFVGDFVFWQPGRTMIEPEGPVSLELDASDTARFYRLAEPELTRFIESSPAHGERKVSVTRETILRFNYPLSVDTNLGSEHLYVEFGGRRLLSRVELATDRRSVRLFYLEPLPSSARLRVIFDPFGLTDAFGRLVDVDGDGEPGGVARIEFDTLSNTPVPGTGIVGTVYASDPMPGGEGMTNFINRPLAGVTITVDGQEETMRAVTDTNGFFRLQPCPAGEFFVHIDGRTLIAEPEGIRYPDLAYYPFVGKSWTAVPGDTNNLAGGTGLIYLPLIVADTLQPVSATEDTVIGFPAAVIAHNPALARVQITVPFNSLHDNNGVRGGKVGIAPVPPDRLAGPLPPGLEVPLVITVQTDGPLNFDRPAPICFPNVPDPATGLMSPPGSKRALVSFNHDTGQWEAVGSMTVSSDGAVVCSDFGVGIVSPGWHADGNTTSGSGGNTIGERGLRGGGNNPPCPEFTPPNGPLERNACRRHPGLYCDQTWRTLCQAHCAQCVENDKSFRACMKRCVNEHRSCLLGRCPSGSGDEPIEKDNVSPTGLTDLVEDYLVRLDGEQFFAIEDLLTGNILLRGTIPPGGSGVTDAVFLPPNSSFQLWILDRESLRLGAAPFATPGAGERYEFPQTMIWDVHDVSEEPLPDSDSDGLTDIQEIVVGSDPINPDSDSDGILDRVELQAGTNPLDGRPAITGIIATTDTPGRAYDMVAADGLAFVADSLSGMAIFALDGAVDTTPVRVAQVDTPGNAQALARSGNLLAVADGAAGVAVIDLTADPADARLTRQVSLPGTTLAVSACGNRVFAASTPGSLFQNISEIDLERGEAIATLTLPGLAVQDVVVQGDYLYVLQLDRLCAVSLLDGEMRLMSATPSPPGFALTDGRMRLSIGGGKAFSVQPRGYNSFSLADPARPELLYSANAENPDLFGWHQIVLTGDDPAVVVKGFEAPDNIDLFDLGDGLGPGTFVTRIVTPGIARAAALYNGLLYVADDTAGLQVINFRQPRPSAGEGPSFTVEASFSLGPAVAEAGSLVTVSANVEEGAPIRMVEFSVNGTRVASVGGLPYETCFVTPPISGPSSTFDLAVKVTDTGGQSQTREFVVRLVADATPPRVKNVTPLGGDRAVSRVIAVFNDAVDPATINESTLQVFAPGLDGLLDTPDDTSITGGIYSLDSANRVVQLEWGSPLPDGWYLARLTTGIADPSGNALQQQFTWSFGVADAVFWVNPFGGEWGEGRNWSTGTVPGPLDSVVVSAPGDFLGGEPLERFAVTIERGTATARNLTIQDRLIVNGTLEVAEEINGSGELVANPNSEIRRATIRLSDSRRLSLAPKGLIRFHGVSIDGDLDLTAGQRLEVRGGFVCRRATLDLSARLDFYGPQTVSGGHFVFGNQAGEGNQGLIEILGAAEVTFGSGVTISGRNGGIEIERGASALINEGVIQADTPDGAITIAGGIFRNRGALRAAGGRLVLACPMSTTDLGAIETLSGSIQLGAALDNRDATLVLDDKSGPLTLIGGGILGGQIDLQGRGQLVFGPRLFNPGNFFDGVTVNGDLKLTDGQTVQVTGGLACRGTIHLDTLGTIGFSGNQTMSSGTIVFGSRSGPSNPGRIGLADDAVLTLGPEVVIRGQRGWVGLDSSRGQVLINEGLISASSAGSSLTITVANLVNAESGIIEAVAEAAEVIIKSPEFADHGITHESNGGRVVLSP